MKRIGLAHWFRRAVWQSALLSVILGNSLLATAAEPIKIVVGWQPYDTISYQVAIIQELKLWKKYMPEGVEIEFQPVTVRGPLFPTT